MLHTMHSYFSYGYNCWGTMSSLDGKGLGSTVIWSPALEQRVIEVYGPATPIEGVYKELRATRVKRPSEMIAIADSSADGWGDVAICVAEKNGAKLLWPGRIHSGGANVLFCDGHVQWYLQSDLVDTTKGNGSSAPPKDPQIRRMWNNDNEPHIQN
jgi:prepilin-type processing-associated H-X9-DG protein